MAMIQNVRDSWENLLLSWSKPSPPRALCYMDFVPPEIISEILTITCDNAGETVYVKWKFPSVTNRVSRRFYQITARTHALWRYIHICSSPYPRDHILARISRPHTRLLVADVTCLSDGPSEGGGDTNDEEDWNELIKIVTPILPRLSSLTFCSLSNNDPIIALLDLHMPMLEALYIEGYASDGNPLPEYDFTPANFPALRILQSKGFLHWEHGDNIPETVEELHLDMDTEFDPSEGFWEFLPAKLRVLELEHLAWEGVSPPDDGKRPLPCLAELNFLECGGPAELSMVQYLDGSCLQKLSICVNDIFDHGMANLPFVLELPNLTHFAWESRSETPPLAKFLRRCPALVSVRLNTFRPLDAISEFVESLSEDPTLLPLLQELKALNTSIFSLYKVVQARPHFKRLEVHILELGLKPLATREEFRQWEECVDWLEDHVELVGNYTGCPGLSTLGIEFYEDDLPRYRSWDDMMAGRAVDTTDWRGIEEADNQFWAKYTLHRMVEFVTVRMADLLAQAEKDSMARALQNMGPSLA